MSKRAKFLDLPTEPAPFNRRVYGAAKAPFALIGEFVFWAGKPWLQALPFALLFAVVVAGLSSTRAVQMDWSQFSIDTFSVAVVWTFYLGAAFAVIKAIRGLLK